MSEKLKPTPGPWHLCTGESDDWDGPVHEDKTSTSAHAIVCDGDVVAFAVVAYDGLNHPRKEKRLTDNARLIAEAGTVFHECGLSPRELLEGYRELRKALKPAVGQTAMPPKSNTLWRLLTNGYDWNYVTSGNLSERDRMALETRAKNTWTAICTEANQDGADDQPADVLDFEAAAKVMAERMDYPWDHMTERGRKHMRESARKVWAALAKHKEV